MAKQYTRHKEYSLILAALAASALFWAGAPSGLAALVPLNVLCIAAVLWSASSVVRHADVLAHRYGEPFGSLILSLSIVILEVGLISVLMLSGAASETLMRDTVYAVLIIVMAGLIGIALLFGGRKYQTQYFNLTGIRHYLISIIPLSVVVLILPSTVGQGGLNGLELAVVAGSCFTLYVVFLRAQTVTHREWFVYEHEDEDDHHHGKPSAHGNLWHFLFLAVHLVTVLGLTKLNSGNLYALLDELHAPPAVAGFLVALLILSPEGTGAMRSVLQNQTQRAMNLFLGSVLATISLTVPVVVVIAALTGQTLVFGLDWPNALLLGTTLAVCQASLSDGETNAHSGAAHVALFAVYVALLFR